MPGSRVVVRYNPQPYGGKRQDKPKPDIFNLKPQDAITLIKRHWNPSELEISLESFQSVLARNISFNWASDVERHIEENGFIQFVVLLSCREDPEYQTKAEESIPFFNNIKYFTFEPHSGLAIINISVADSARAGDAASSYEVTKIKIDYETIKSTSHPATENNDVAAFISNSQLFVTSGYPDSQGGAGPTAKNFILRFNPGVHKFIETYELLDKIKAAVSNEKQKQGGSKRHAPLASMNAMRESPKPAAKPAAKKSQSYDRESSTTPSRGWGDDEDVDEDKDEDCRGDYLSAAKRAPPAGKDGKNELDNLPLSQTKEILQLNIDERDKVAADLKTKIDDNMRMTAEIESLHDENEKLRKENEELTAKNNSLHDANNELMKTIAKLTAQLSSSDSADTTKPAAVPNDVASANLTTPMVDGQIKSPSASKDSASTDLLTNPVQQDTPREDSTLSRVLKEKGAEQLVCPSPTDITKELYHELRAHISNELNNHTSKLQEQIAEEGKDQLCYKKKIKQLKENLRVIAENLNKFVANNIPTAAQRHANMYNAHYSDWLTLKDDTNTFLSQIVVDMLDSLIE
tara:strand:- start:216 stop:1946 length:1731 start_codon:yes stop_codon:yes gene_type:complete